VTRAGRVVDLTVREFELLECLLRNEGQIVSRDTLARNVWKSGSAFRMTLPATPSHGRRRLSHG